MATAAWYDQITEDWSNDFPWLVRLLKDVPSLQKNGKGNEKSSITIWNSSPSQPPQTFTYLPVRPVADDLWTALSSEGVCFIYVEHRPLWVNLNMSLIQALHEITDFDPAFLHHHLGVLDKGDPDDFFTLLPSSNKFLQLSFAAQIGHVTAAVLVGKNQPIVLCFGCMHPGRSLVDFQTNSPRSRQMAAFNPQRSAKLREQHPNDHLGLLNLAFLLSCEAQISNQKLTVMEKMLAGISKISDRAKIAHMKYMLSVMNRFRDLQDTKESTQAHLVRFHKFCNEQGMACALFDSVLLDFQHVLDKCDRIAGYWALSAQTMWTFMGIEQAREGITSAESVRSVLCYTFLELLTLWDSQWIQNTLLLKLIVALRNKIVVAFKRLVTWKPPEGGSLHPTKATKGV
ncbi:MAG: hypothetical protein Q9162_004119 [Coniocarpon cinnabarinum]